MKNIENKKVAIIACSGIIDIVNEAFKTADIEYKIFDFKAPCIFNIEEKYFEHYFDLASEYSTNILVLLGNCSPFLDKYLKKFNALKIEGDNCFDMLIPPATYKKLIRNKSMLLLPAQVFNIKTYLKQMGMNDKDGMDMYHSLLNNLVFLNPSEKPFKQKTIDSMNEAFQLPSQIIEFNLERFKSKISSEINIHF